MEAVQSCLPIWSSNNNRTISDSLHKKVEDYRPGYPRFTALLSVYKPYFVFRRFDKLRARLLLLKQDRLSMLEEKLEQIDQQENIALFLGQSRRDTNQERRTVLSEIETCMKDYDTARMMSLNDAQPRDVESLAQWLGRGSLAREESRYLSSRDLAALAPVTDNATVQLEAWVESLFIKFYSGFRKRASHDWSDDPDVFADSGYLVQRTSKAILLCIITLFLLMPIIICSCINSIWMRLVVILSFTMCYLIVVSGLTQSRTMELIVAGATYATVLTVFVPGTMQGSS